MPPNDPYKYFRVEARELIELLNQGALEIGKGSGSAATVAALLRHAHTLKGAARVVKQLPMGDHAHGIEDLLAPYRGVAGAVPRECADPLLERVDALEALLRELGGPVPEALAAAVGRARDNAPRAVPDAPESSVRTDAAEIEAVLEGLGAARAEVTELRDATQLLEDVRRVGELLGQSLAAPRRADSARLRAALDKAQRLTEDLSQGLRRVERGLAEGVERVARELEETHTAAERLRLVPASSVFNALERAVRDVAQELGKRVAFSAAGGDVKLEARVLTLAQNGLLHVVRNAVVHGIEPEAQRRAAGKPGQGAVRLSVRRERRSVLFVCEDDGAGLDLDSVRRELVRQGRALDAQAEPALLAELLRGGISTAARVTGVSGRGVGLDVLRDAAEQLGGEVRLATQRGHGLRVQLSLPLAIAGFEGVMVECQGRSVSVPLAAVVQSARFRHEEITRSVAGESVCHQGQVIAFAPLSRALGGAVRESRAAWSALIVRGAHGKVALGVDRLLGARELVLRPLPAAARASRVVAGATLDALGNPELVLDPDGLVQELQRPAGIEPPAPALRPPILIVDDSLTTRMLEQSILESAGYEVDLAISGEEGLAKARARRYGLFLVDVEMPGIDGFTFIERAAADPALSGIPAVLVSSLSRSEDLARGKSVGARGYIVKDSFDQRRLLGLIEQLLDE